jgi:hypothetical protein
MVLWVRERISRRLLLLPPLLLLLFDVLFAAADTGVEGTTGRCPL